MKSTPRKTPTPCRTEAVPEPEPTPALPPILIHGDVDIPEGYLTEADQRSLLGLPAAPRRTGRLAWLWPIKAVETLVAPVKPIAGIPSPAAAPTLVRGGAGLPEFSRRAAGSWTWRCLSAAESSGEVLRPGLMWRSRQTFFFCYRHDGTAGYPYRCVRMLGNNGTWRLEFDAFENDRFMRNELKEVEAICEPILPATTSTALASLPRYAIQHIGPSHEEIKNIFQSIGLDLDDLFYSYGALNPS